MDFDEPIFTNTTNSTTETANTDADNPTSNTNAETTETETDDLDLQDFDIIKKLLNNKYDSLYTLSKVQSEIAKILKK
tara:strand:+ start:1556 stop:1789 length:234 start_codon:yes stop_codon:yes gene_type:complete